MQTSIVRLEITGLNGIPRISIPVRNNIILLVGMNGLGKTTAMNVFYYLISRQWQRLYDITFDTVTLETTSEPIRLDRTEIADYLSWRERKGRVSPSTNKILDILTEHGLLSEFLDTPVSNLDRFEYLLRTSERMMARSRQEIRHLVNLVPNKSGAVRDAINRLEAIIEESQILYLPTYRRIEKDIGNIIPDFEQFLQYRSPGHREVLGRRTKTYAELIEFGMKDIEKKISDNLYELNDNNRKEFNALAGSYLSDVIRGQGRNYNPAEIAELKGKTYDNMISRVEENTLNDADKVLLSDAITRLRSGEPNSDDPYVAHFLSKLNVLATKLTEREKPVTDFVSVCNKYLYNKKLIYDENTYKVFVQGRWSKEIPLQHLSSGEKQILSIFANLYLSGERKYIIMIDEPELSLSMTWQMTFLTDIVDSKRCSFLFAVTHSPFISENELDTYVVDMQDCIDK